MKKILFSLTVAAFMLTSVSVNAQKVKVQAAFNHYKFDELDKAKEAIDQTVTNESTKTMAKAWYYRGLIYQAIYKHKTFGNLDSNPPSVAFASYQKSLELDAKSEFVDDINLRIGMIAFYKGIEDYKIKNYAAAFSAFEFVVNKNPNDTLGLLYAAYSAEYAKNGEKAIVHYKKLMEMNYKDLEPNKTSIYLELALIYKRELKDTTKALEYITLGRQKYPDANNLIREEANIYLQTGKNQEAINALELAITKTPDDSTLHLVLAGVYDNLAVSYRTKDSMKADAYFSKAETTYKKAIQLNPNFFEAYFNLGAMYFNRGAEIANAANNLTDAEYNKAKMRADEKLREALPYLEKAFDMNPKDKNTLISLRQLYVRIGETEKYNKVKAILDELK